MALVTRKIRHKNGDGSIVEAEIGAKAENVLEDENHRFVTDAEKTSWNGKVDSSGGNIANTKVSEFAASSTQWPVPAAGESPKTLWGKVKKFTEDFKNWMSGVCLIGQIVNNCVTNNANLPLSAAQGKVLMDLYTVLNTKQTANELKLEMLTYFESQSLKTYLNVNIVDMTANPGVIYYRYGKVISVLLYDIVIRNTIAASTDTIVDHLPESAQECTFMAVCDKNDNLRSARISIRPNESAIRLWYNGAIESAHFTTMLTYIAK